MNSLTTFIVFVLIFFAAYSSKSHIFLHHDEVNYIYDGFRVLRGDVPSFMHSPAGSYLFIKAFIILCLVLIKTFSGFYSSIDFAYYSLLTNFEIIKFIYVALINVALVILAKERFSIALALSILTIISSEFRGLLLSSMPYSLAMILALYAHRFYFSDSTPFSFKNLDMVFLGAAIGCRLEFVLLIPLFMTKGNIEIKEIIKRLLLCFMTVFLTAPWLILYPVGPIKIIIGYIYVHKSLLLFLVFIIILIPLIIKKIKKENLIHIIGLFLALVVIFSLFNDRVSLRWALGPLLIVTILYLERFLIKLENIPKVTYSKLLLLFFSGTLIFFSQLKDKNYTDDTPNLIEEKLIKDEFNIYINCVINSKKRKEKLADIGLNSFFINSILEHTNLEKKQLERYKEIKFLQSMLNINSFEERKPLKSKGGNYGDCIKK
ncbi:MAG: hypothetical protein CBB97_07605 [Candidatus Endolissoclinum sp. TMED37]|nr:MAG: hypothetical protein CBB97_07605 [Candidatus Endolissoclinum sp. TMED37]|tara:strand:+ start:1924 stop:3222 length:1299 start_codon:yes stop_codon:yes gene_type:complete